ncbi:CDP-glycerol:poly(glycerophosphate) glycerophosphotransferase [Haloactinospora alba]|uniref:CDP-glycerol:poly(Glycerophosphate) glycerophosphotransferase n=1 Tax=Haloactinospora alba TaxID=405555 RepID=A0A543NH33_9ACTN|nr:CDP-glycerol:glycerophosphate glycerophosphotransferase [Haloactinospora alba]TQN31094.1 CDP-glycerol:poly(glycerophosphate) glycerophosphotransferase [Haloactinospora alba]
MPELSVIVVFDVTEPHLSPCLASLTGQTAASDGDLEVVLAPVRHSPAPEGEHGTVVRAVDGEDGTELADAEVPGGDEEAGTGTAPVEEADPAEGEEPAESGESEAADTLREEGAAAARAFAANPPRGIEATMVGHSSAGRAEARRIGAEAASGEYLMFLDGADRLTSYALAYLLETLKASGADVATGNVYRFNELGTRPSRAHQKPCGRQRTCTNVRSVPSLLGDRLYGNKLWRRSFWENLPRTDVADPDTDLAVVRALFAATAVDVLPAPVHLCRDRERTDDYRDVATLTRRIAAVAELSSALPESDRNVWDHRALCHDVCSVLLRMDDADQQARERFYELVGNQYLGRVDRHVLDRLSPLHRLNYYLVRQRQDARLLELLTFQKSVELKKAPLVRRGVHYYIKYPFFEDKDSGIPREVYRVGPDLKVRQKTENVEWRGGQLVVSGRVGIAHLRARRRWQQQLVAFAVNPATGRRVSVPVRMRRAAEYRLADRPDAARHDYGGFEVTVNPEKLRVSGSWQAAEWQLELVVINRGIVRRRTIANPVSGQPQRPPYQRIAGDVWIRPTWNQDGKLSIDVDPLRARVIECRRENRDGGAGLRIAGELVAPPAAHARELRLTRLPGTAVLHYPLRCTGGRFEASVPVSEVVERAVAEGEGQLSQEQWRVELVTHEGNTVPLILPDALETAVYPADGNQQEVAVQRTSTGHLQLRAGWAHPVLHEARWSGDELELVGSYTAASELELVFAARGREEEHLLTLHRDGGTFRARFSPSRIPTLSGTLPLSAGSYQLWARVRAADGNTSGVRVEISPDSVRELPVSLEKPERSYTFADAGFDTPILRVGSDLFPEERGSFAQRQLRENVYPVLRTQELREEVFFDSFTGRQFSDSPHSIYTALRSRGGSWADYPMSWLVSDGQVSLPDDVRQVRYHGREFYESLARSRYIVTNSRQPAWFDRRSDQVVVQTWHGSMLKRIGFDIENIRGKSRDYHEKLSWETQQWDYLVSPSPWATPILRRAFRFDGEILETGYPRNDIFFSPDRDAIAERTRQRLGLPPDKKVVLYAPTWRDDKYYTRGKHKLDLHLDLYRMYEKLGEDHVLLVRRHPRVVDSVPTVGTNFVYDVSLYPEIMELFLVTDVLVTDYSSMMFDFANTGRPMLFFTYDIESYRDSLRGFYFDFEETAPGPLLKRSDDVIDALLNIGEVSDRYGSAYRRFTDQFCPLDDGNAAARVVDRVFGRG